MLPKLVRLFTLLVLSIACSGAIAVKPASPITSLSTTITPDKVKAKLKEVDASSDLDENTKKTLTELYLKTLSNLEKQQTNSDQAAAFKKAREKAPTESKAIRDKLERAKKESPTVTLPVSKNTPLAQVEQALANEKANQAAIDAKLAELQKQLTAKADHPTSGCCVRLLSYDSEL